MFAFTKDKSWAKKSRHRTKKGPGRMPYRKTEKPKNGHPR